MNEGGDSVGDEGLEAIEGSEGEVLEGFCERGERCRLRSFFFFLPRVSLRNPKRKFSPKGPLVSRFLIKRGGGVLTFFLKKGFFRKRLFKNYFFLFYIFIFLFFSLFSIFCIIIFFFK